ncbi:hypothetical protein N431DRAFT_241675 [Stipitochalara longipes BDJ]|nr:hypothetical protein N431DRAFT_241675 [Stipitochalara longipes BDJ]
MPDRRSLDAPRANAPRTLPSHQHRIGWRTVGAILPFTRRHLMASHMTLALFADGGPYRGDIHHSARSNTYTHAQAPASYPPSQQQNLHHPMLPLSTSIKTWFIIISLLHVALASSQFSGISERARERGSVGFAFRNSSFDGPRYVLRVSCCFCWLTRLSRSKSWRP